jgi:hypothetical protein
MRRTHNVVAHLAHGALGQHGEVALALVLLGLGLEQLLRGRHLDAQRGEVRTHHLDAALVLRRLLRLARQRRVARDELLVDRAVLRVGEGRHGQQDVLLGRAARAALAAAAAAAAAFDVVAAAVSAAVAIAVAEKAAAAEERRVAAAAAATVPASAAAADRVLEAGVLAAVGAAAATAAASAASAADSDAAERIVRRGHGGRSPVARPRPRRGVKDLQRLGR